VENAWKFSISVSGTAPKPLLFRVAAWMELLTDSVMRKLCGLTFCRVMSPSDDPDMETVLSW
jgi:hypothetical protein